MNQANNFCDLSAAVQSSEPGASWEASVGWEKRRVKHLCFSSPCHCKKFHNLPTY